MVTSSWGNALAEILLAHLKGEDGLETLDTVPVVREFMDVFGDILGLPPVREIKFCIDLLPGTALIYRTLYRMVLVESAELKK